MEMEKITAKEKRGEDDADRPEEEERRREWSGGRDDRKMERLETEGQPVK